VWAIGSGIGHGFAFDRAARAWSWGDNGSGQLGINLVGTTSLVPARAFLTALAASGGWQHSLAVAPDGRVWSFGLATAGRLGTGASSGTEATPVPIPDFSLVTNTWLVGDPDLDQLPTWREYLMGTDPLNADTNGNGLPDGIDEAHSGAPDNPDSDGDGVPNWMEIANGTDPFRADSDGDGVHDGADAFPLDPTRWQAPTPNPSDTTPPVILLKEPVSARPVPPPL
jgi:hypothetical protein